jgi:hypothetical protein
MDGYVFEGLTLKVSIMQQTKIKLTYEVKPLVIKHDALLEKIPGFPNEVKIKEGFATVSYSTRSHAEESLQKLNGLIINSTTLSAKIILNQNILLKIPVGTEIMLFRNQIEEFGKLKSFKAIHDLTKNYVIATFKKVIISFN